MRTCVTGTTGYVGGSLAARLVADGHEVTGLSRRPGAAAPGVRMVQGDVEAGTGLDEALDGVDVAYYLVHSMEKPPPGVDARAFVERELLSAQHFVGAARRAGVRRIVYLGGLVPQDAPLSRHLGSRLAVEEVLLQGAPSSIAFRASIVIGAKSRSFRFLVRLVERTPVLPLPGWARFRTQPIDGRDMTNFLVKAATAPDELGGRSWDVVGPDTMTYGEMVESIADLMLLRRPPIRFGFSLTGIAGPVAAAIAGEDVGLVGPLMESLGDDLLARPGAGDAAKAFGVRTHRFEAAVERALREWEATETLAAR